MRLIKMSMRQMTILLILGTFVLDTKAQTQNNRNSPIRYGIDSKMKRIIDKQTYSETNLISGCTEVRSYENDSLINFNRYNKHELVFYHDPIFRNDTLFFFLAAPKGWQVHVAITKDSCVIELVTLESLISNYKSDSNTIITSKRISCQNRKLTLVRKPIIKTGTSILGIIELTSDDYLDFRDSKDKKYRFQLKTYFNIEIPKQENY